MPHLPWRSDDVWVLPRHRRDWKKAHYRGAWSWYDVSSDQLPQTFDLRSPGVDGRLHRRHVAFDQNRHVSAAELFLADDFDGGGFGGGVDGFDDGGEALR